MIRDGVCVCADGFMMLNGVCVPTSFESGGQVDDGNSFIPAMTFSGNA